MSHVAKLIASAMLLAALSSSCSVVGDKDANGKNKAVKTGNTFVVNNRAANASDENPGTEASPLKTIQAGADRAQPGDTVLVRAGIYREEVIPPRGSTSPDSTCRLFNHSKAANRTSVSGCMGESPVKRVLPSAFPHIIQNCL